MTNQEKMQYIYERTGVEPKYISNEYGELLTPNKKISEYDLLEGSYAYFPAEQLWEMLISDKSIYKGIGLGEFPLNSVGNLHTALINMVVWSIKQGHIKG